MTLTPLQADAVAMAFAMAAFDQLLPHPILTHAT